jgi:hypothetical protein
MFKRCSHQAPRPHTQCLGGQREPTVVQKGCATAAAGSGSSEVRGVKEVRGGGSGTLSVSPSAFPWLAFFTAATFFRSLASCLARFLRHAVQPPSVSARRQRSALPI